MKPINPPKGHFHYRISETHFVARDGDNWVSQSLDRRSTPEFPFFPEGGAFYGVTGNIGWGQLKPADTGLPFCIDLSEQVSPLSPPFTDFKVPGDEILYGATLGNEVVLATNSHLFSLRDGRPGFVVDLKIEAADELGFPFGLYVDPTGKICLLTKAGSKLTSQKFDKSGALLSTSSDFENNEFGSKMFWGGYGEYHGRKIAVVQTNDEDGPDDGCVHIWIDNHYSGAVRSENRIYRQRHSDTLRVLPNGLILLEERFKVVLPGTTNTIPAGSLIPRNTAKNIGKLVDGAVTSDGKTLLAFERGIFEVRF